MLRRLFVAFVIALAVVSLGSTAFAAKKRKKAPVTNDDALQRKTVYNFEDDVITGSLLKPDATIIDSIRNSKYSSLIKIRQNFIPEIIKSAEDL